MSPKTSHHQTTLSFGRISRATNYAKDTASRGFRSHKTSQKLTKIHKKTAAFAGAVTSR
jgi:hypothetical protein